VKSTCLSEECHPKTNKLVKMISNNYLLSKWGMPCNVSCLLSCKVLDTSNKLEISSGIKFKSKVLFNPAKLLYELSVFDNYLVKWTNCGTPLSPENARARENFELHVTDG
jgi:hypothetical protein